MRAEVLHGDCLAVLQTLAPGSVDAIVTDPPYGLAFMGKDWDHGIPGVPFWEAALTVAKPGAHLLAFGGTRTFHRLTCAVEDAGWEIRDSIGWNHLEPIFCRCSALPYSHADSQLRDVSEADPSGALASPPQQGSILRSLVSEQDVRGSLSRDGAQRPGGLDSGEPGELPHKDDRPPQPGVEGRGDDLQDARPVRGRAVRPSAGVGEADGASGRVRDGASAGHGADVRAVAGPDRGGPSSGPQADGQRTDEPRTLAVEWIAQGGGAWPGCPRCGKPLAPPFFAGPLAWNYGSGFPKSHNLDGDWQGWGTALKPAWEPIILARKPLMGTVAANVVEHGTGALNIDGCRVATDAPRPALERRADPRLDETRSAYGRGINGSRAVDDTMLGRWPANVALDEDAARALDEQSGERPGMAVQAVLHRGATTGKGLDYGSSSPTTPSEAVGYGDTGGASRFFYCAKASRAERELGLDGERRQPDEGRDPDAPGSHNPRNRGATPTRNHHPTVKPVALMRWLCRLVTPPGGLVCDPFAGSGTTGIAAALEGFAFLGIEREAEYVAIARRRIAEAQAQTTLGLEVRLSQPTPKEDTV